MRITTKGQVTIPIAVRERLGLLPATEVEFRVEGDSVRLVKVKSPDRGRSTEVVDRLRGSASTRMSTDEILALTRND